MVGQSRRFPYIWHYPVRYEQYNAKLTRAQLDTFSWASFWDEIASKFNDSDLTYVNEWGLDYPRLKDIDPFAEILVARFNEIEIESYSEDENGIKAYAPTKLFNKDAVKETLNKFNKE